MTRRFAGLELMPTAAIVFTPGRRVHLWNGAAERHFGWAAEEVIGHLPKWIPRARTEEYLAISSRVRAGETIRDFDTVRLRRDGTEAIVSLTLQPVPDDEGAIWVLASVIDVSERRRMVSELAAEKRRYRAIADALRLAQQQREMLMRLVVHDFKSPIAVVLVNLRFLREQSELSAESQEAVSDASANARALNDLTLNLLDICRSEDGKLVAHRRSTDVTALVRGVLAERGANAKTSLRAEPIPGAAIDPDLFRRVIRNLVDNAFKYGRSSPVTVTCETSAGTLRVTVADEGAGIPEAARERIFDKYFRVNECAINDARPSHGLGLTFCKLAVEAHGGTIRVHENIPTGCRFVVEIPDAL